MTVAFNKVNETILDGQFRKLLTVNNQFVLVGGTDPITGPRLDFSAVAYSIDAQTGEVNWKSSVEKTRPFVHAASQGHFLFVSIPTNFSHSFTVVVCYEIETGSVLRRYAREDVLLGFAALSKKLFFATGLQGNYGIYSIEESEIAMIKCGLELGTRLKSICAGDEDILIASSVDSRQEELEFVLKAFRPSGEDLWSIRTRKHAGNCANLLTKVVHGLINSCRERIAVWLMSQLYHIYELES